jgi:hypothetical protein
MNDPAKERNCHLGTCIASGTSRYFGKPGSRDGAHFSRPIAVDHPTMGNELGAQIGASSAHEVPSQPGEGRVVEEGKKFVGTIGEGLPHLRPIQIADSIKDRPDPTNVEIFAGIVHTARCCPFASKDVWVWLLSCKRHYSAL